MVASVEKEQVAELIKENSAIDQQLSQIIQKKLQKKSQVIDGDLLPNENFR